MTESSSHTFGLTRQAGLRLALLGVAVGAAVGAGTGMWWMMGLLGGTFPGVARWAART